MHHTRVLLSYDIYIKPYFKLYNCAGQHRTTEYDTYYRHHPHVNFTQGNREWWWWYEVSPRAARPEERKQKHGERLCLGGVVR